MKTTAPPRSLERGLHLLQLLQDHETLSFSALVDLMGLPNTTVTRLLNALLELSYIEKTESGLYRLCASRRMPGANRVSPQRLQETARPMLQYMHRKMHNTALLLYWSGQQTICLERILHEESAPLHGPGHIIADHSFTPWGYFVSNPHNWLRLPSQKLNDKPRHPLSKYSVDQMLRLYKQHGYTYDLMMNRNRIAAPIYFYTEICGILVLGGTPQSLPLKDIKQYGPVLKDLADSCRQLL